MLALWSGGESKGGDKHDGKKDHLYHFRDISPCPGAEQLAVLERSRSSLKEG
jgi:hypothetical protein